MGRGLLGRHVITVAQYEYTQYEYTHVVLPHVQKAPAGCSSFKGNYYAGTVGAIIYFEGNFKYKIEFDDGAVEYDVEESSLKKFVPPKQQAPVPPTGPV